MYYQKPLIGVKGHIQTRSFEKDETYTQVMELVAEKVTFLSSKRQEAE